MTHHQFKKLSSGDLIKFNGKIFWYEERKWESIETNCIFLKLLEGKTKKVNLDLAMYMPNSNPHLFICKIFFDNKSLFAIVNPDTFNVIQ
jgi:hypothetical protein